MEGQMFLVTLEVPPAFGHCFPKADAEHMANIIRDAVRARIWSFKGWVPFKITVAKDGKEVSASGEVPEHVLSEFDKVPMEMAASAIPEKKAAQWGLSDCQ